MRNLKEGEHQQCQLVRYLGRADKDIIWPPMVVTLNTKHDKEDNDKLYEGEKVTQSGANVSSAEERLRRGEEISRFIQVQDKEMDEFVSKRDKLMKAHEERRSELKRKHMAEEIELEKEVDEEFNKLIGESM
ncbi:hypothetical protein SASPL_135628 [Salvia splendens]|uniref:Uncharacterized protein n=1 Tax=Salvia splendens TaxID=180675 RepID=A0A8X8ZG56_SALSN|nr:hypothetical protein SASPL_135628 [Salvia splendens]